MKKIVASLVVLLCLLFGSALAEDVVNICGTEYSVTTTPRYFLVAMGSEPVETGANASNYNLKLVLENGVPTITLRNAYIETYSGAVFSTESSLVIRGVGDNRLQTQAVGYVSIRTGGDFTFEGQISGILNNRGKNIYIDGNCTVAKGANIGLIEGPNSFEMYIEGQLRVDGKIGSIGNGDANECIFARKGLLLNGSIGEINCKQTGIIANGDVVLNGSLGDINVKNTAEAVGDACGITTYSKLIVNHSTGLISVNNELPNLGAVQASKGIELGSGVRILQPKNGRFGSDAGATVVMDADGFISPVAQFGKAAEPAPETGDGMNIALWASLLTISMIGIAILSKKSKKTN